MHKLLPFRQYDEKDVINIFSLEIGSGGTDYINLKAGGTGNNVEHYSGTGVAVSGFTRTNGSTVPEVLGNTGTLGGDAPGLTDTESYLGGVVNGLGHTLGQGSQYPIASGSVKATTASNPNFLGITLRATLAYDENAEKLLYYSRKLEELQAVLPRQAVPVATRGMFTFTVGANSAFANLTNTGAGAGVSAAANGKFTAAVPSAGAAASGAAGDVGVILATGKNGGKDVALVQIAPR